MADYNKFKDTTIEGEKGTTWHIEIYKKNWNGSSSSITLANEGFEITWNGEGETRKRVFLGSQCNLFIFIENNADKLWVKQILENGYEYHFLRIYKNSVNDANLWWYGWIQPSFDTFENRPYPYIYKIIATDSYGYYNKRKPDKFSGTTEKMQIQKIKDVILDFNDIMNISSTSATNNKPNPHNRKWLRNSIDWWRPGDYSSTNDPFNTYFMIKGAFANESKFNEITENVEVIDLSNRPFEYKNSDVFNGILKTFNAVGFLSDGYYNIIQPNSLDGVTNGVIKSNEYLNKNDNPNNTTVNTLLTISDDNNNHILGGSTFTFEPALESVTATFINGFTSVNIPQGENLQTSSSSTYGSLNTSSGLLQMNFSSIHTRTVLKSDFTFSSDVGSQPYEITSNSYTATLVLRVKLSDGTNNRYLQEVATNNFSLNWSQSETNLTIVRGYNAQNFLSPLNDSTAFCVGNVQGNPNSYNFGGGVGFAFENTVAGTITTKTNINFSAKVEEPDITGDVSFEVVSMTIDYFQSLDTSPQSAAITTPLYDTINDPTTDSVNTLISDGITISQIQNNLETNNSGGQIFTSTQTTNKAFENFDLGDVTLGQFTGNMLHSIIFLDTSGSVDVHKSMTPGMERGNPSPSAPLNLTKLLTKEFLELQTEPLKILQASIQSANISPLKIIKYPMSDGTNEYYQFLGGTFKAQSEIMSGEWYLLSAESDRVITNLEPVNIGQTPGQIIRQVDFVDNLSMNNLLNIKSNILKNSLGVISQAINSNTNTSKIPLSSNLNALIYNNQKLLLSFPDGSNPIELVADGNTQKNASEVNINQISFPIKYPEKSILSFVLSDLTNVLTTGFGNNLVNNGTFTSSSNWTSVINGNSTISIANNLVTFTVDSGDYVKLSQTITYTPGKIYQLSATVNGTAGKDVRFRDDSNDSGGLTITTGGVTMTGSSQNITLSFVANSNSDEITIERGTTSGNYSFTVDNVILQEFLGQGVASSGGGGSGVSSLNDLTLDATTLDDPKFEVSTTPTLNDVIKWNGSKFVNTTLDRTFTPSIDTFTVSISSTGFNVILNNDRQELMGIPETTHISNATVLLTQNFSNTVESDLVSKELKVDPANGQTQSSVSNTAVSSSPIYSQANQNIHHTFTSLNFQYPKLNNDGFTWTTGNSDRQQVFQSKTQFSSISNGNEQNKYLRIKYYNRHYLVASTKDGSNNGTDNRLTASDITGSYTFRGNVQGGTTGSNTSIASFTLTATNQFFYYVVPKRILLSDTSDFDSSITQNNVSFLVGVASDNLSTDLDWNNQGEQFTTEYNDGSTTSNIVNGIDNGTGFIEEYVILRAPNGLNNSTGVSNFFIKVSY